MNVYVLVRFFCLIHGSFILTAGRYIQSSSRSSLEEPVPFPCIVLLDPSFSSLSVQHCSTWAVPGESCRSARGGSSGPCACCCLFVRHWDTGLGACSRLPPALCSLFICASWHLVHLLLCWLPQRAESEFSEMSFFSPRQLEVIRLIYLFFPTNYKPMMVVQSLKASV